ncbi:hypothetical protein [Streptomyces vinaceus]|uniref:hypothetical protein n=1 Tax=Streptomyces vinaceus TaxID=1960 RepID=UPI0038199D87
MAERSGLTVEQVAALATELIYAGATAVFDAPATATVDRLPAAQQHAAGRFGRCAAGRRAWGHRGRTLSGVSCPGLVHVRDWTIGAYAYRAEPVLAAAPVRSSFPDSGVEVAVRV